MKVSRVRPVFVEFIPDALEEGVLYISERFRMCSHKCCCGCGEEVITPLSPAEWRLTKIGDLVSLWPSIGNWDYACRSHYVIRLNEVKWAPPMTASQIVRVRQRDMADLKTLATLTNLTKMTSGTIKTSPPETDYPHETIVSIGARLLKKIKAVVRAVLEEVGGR